LNTRANSINPNAKGGETVHSAPGSNKPDLKDPAVILELLEADQVVAAKQQSRFGSRSLSPGLRALLWGLRVYVLVMIVMVVISVIRAAHATP
jgi:hypothetical protein